jgi:hypothetical protein
VKNSQESKKMKLRAIALSVISALCININTAQANPLVNPNPKEHLHEVKGTGNNGEKFYYGGVVDVQNGVTTFIYGIENKPLRVGYLSCDKKIWIVRTNYETTLVVQANSAGSLNLIEAACQEAEFIHAEATSNVP